MDFSSFTDAYVVTFNPDVSEAQVGYVDVRWALKKLTDPSNAPPIEYDFRMKKESRDIFTNELRYTDVEEKIKLDNGDILRYFFRYWVVPKNSADSGFLCTTPVKWFASPILARQQD